jgi:hypothetical protein
MPRNNGRFNEDERLVEAKKRLLDVWLQSLQGGCDGVLAHRDGTTLYLGPDLRYPQSWMGGMVAIQVHIPSEPRDTPQDLTRYRIVVLERCGSHWTVLSDGDYSIAEHNPAVVLQNLFNALIEMASDTSRWS